MRARKLARILRSLLLGPGILLCVIARDPASSTACMGCHEQKSNLWRTSGHALAMAADAVRTLNDASTRLRYNRDILVALAAFERDGGGLPAVLEHTGTLARTRPDNESLLQLFQHSSRTEWPGIARLS